MLSGLAGALLGLSAACPFAFERLTHALRAYWETAIAANLAGAPVAATRLLEDSAWALGSLLLAMALGASLLSLLASGFSLRLPFARPRHAFAPLRMPRTPRLLLACAMAVLTANFAFDALQLTASSFPGHVLRFVLGLSGLVLLCAVLEAVLARTAFIKSLWLSRSEHMDEQREAYGAPEIRAARARARRESLSQGAR